MNAEPEPSSKAVEPAKSAQAIPSERLLAWLWGKTPSDEATPLRALDWSRHANLALELAQRALEPLEPLSHGPAYGAACDLLRQSIYWALLAKEYSAETAEAALPDFDTLFQRAAHPLLVACAGSERELETLSEALSRRGFVEYAELTPAEAEALSRRLRAFAEALVEDLDSRQLARERLWFRRARRIGAVLLGFAVLGLGIKLWQDARESAGDLAQGKAWTASSLYAEGCTSPEQKCDKSPAFFVHTLEERDPWVMFDLGKPESISKVRISNRIDCCTERATPLVIEVSLDKQHWKEVARSKEEFTTFRAAFPSVQARYVKLHVPRVTNLHLRRVQILP